MKEDLKTLINLDDYYIFLSDSTNEFITKTHDEKDFNRLCEEFIKNFGQN